jgi:exopolyphosphatase/pppGpp-phosphohydrolase
VAYAYTLWREVRRRRAFREEEDQRARQNCLDNLEMVASALSQGQVDVTEGAWRCKALLEILDPELMERPVFRAFGEVYERTRHLHTHSAREALSPQERLKEDRQRLEIEEEMREPVLNAAGAVLEFRRRWPESRY